MRPLLTTAQAAHDAGLVRTIAHTPMSMTWGEITAETGGRVSCYQQTDGQWAGSCTSCGTTTVGTEQAVRAAGAAHLRARTLCSIRP